MSTVTNLNQTLDGINPIDTLGTPRNWDVVQSGPTYGFLGFLNNRNNTADDELIANVSITGTNWQIVTLRYSAAFDNTTILHDLDGQTGRRIKYLELGQNSDVDLISTRVDFILGGDGLLHDVKLGSELTRSLNLFADQNNVETGSGYVGSIETGGTSDITIRAGGAGIVDTENGDDTINTFGGWVGFINAHGGDDQVKIGAGGAGYVNLGTGANTLNTKAGWVQSAESYNGSNNVSIGAGGIGQLSFATDGGTFTTQTVTADGWIGSLTAHNNNTVSLTLGDAGGGSFRLSDGNDTVTLGAGDVDSIFTRGGDDVVMMGSGLPVFMNLGSGDDHLAVADLAADVGFSVNARQGNDTIDFSAYGDEVVFSLNREGEWQNPGAPNGDIDLAGLGYVQATGFENVIGSRFSDLLTGDENDNLLSGDKGADLLKGGFGADILDGGRGRDRMYAGKDTEQDTFRFNDVNETFKGKNKDRLFNFESGEDLIDLSGIDANTSLGGDQAFAFGGTSAAANSVWYTVKGSNVLVNADNDGDGVSDFVVLVLGVSALTAGDFVA